MNALLPLFLEETQELIDHAARDLVALEQGQGDAAALLDGIFRHFHTLKGGAALFDFAPMTGLLHTAEDVLDAARQGRLSAGRSLVDALLHCLDDVRAWLPDIAAHEALPADAPARAGRSKALLALLLQGQAEAAAAAVAGTGTLVEELLDEQAILLSHEQPATRAAAAGRVEAAGDDAAAVLAAITATDAPAPAPPARMLRVSPERVEQMMTLAGEAVIARNGLQHIVAEAGREAAGAAFLGPLKAQTAALDRLVRDWYEAAARLRMIRVGDIFARVPRLVRDLAQQLGRDVQVRMEGEALEADRDVLEGLFDPLMHLVRNALDHGVEDPAGRAAAGKPATASLWLRARGAAGTLVIEVEDDGRGLDLAALRARVAARGLMPAGAVAALDDAAAAELVFLPGLSTAASVTTLSGRGVGMDAVRSAVQAAGGLVSIHTRGEGQGTCVRMTLPAQVSMRPVMMVQAGAQWFGVPLDAVRSTHRVPLARIRAMPAAGETGCGVSAPRFFALGEQIIPLIDLAQTLGLAPRPPTAGALVLVLESDGGPVGLSVDGFGPRADVVLRPLAGLLAGTPCYLGSAVLGDGSVLLVLDVRAVVT